jgi:hypothetical protein
MSDQSTQPTSGLAVEIIETIVGQPGITVPEIALALDVPPSAVYRQMPLIAHAVEKAKRRFYSPGGRPQEPAAPADTPARAAEPPAAPEDKSADPAAELVIRHSNSEGTLVHGTSRGDGSRDALRGAHFRWSRSLSAWYKPNTRGRSAKRATIEVLRAALVDAGFTVTVEIEDFDAAEAFETLQGHGEERAAVHAGRAARETGRSDASYLASNEAVRGIEPGQPILLGHHSQRRHERDIARSHTHMSASVEHSRKAERAEGRAAEVQRQTRRRENPVVMGRRVERLERNQRTLERRLRGASEAPNTRAELADIKTEIEFLRSSIAGSGVKQYTRADLQPGDKVKIRGSWDTVLKANPKTVEAQGDHGLRIKYPYYEITDHQQAGSASG